MLGVGPFNRRASRPRVQDVELKHVTREAKLLISLADDVREQVEKKELQPGHRRKREVGVWLMNVEEAKMELQRIEKKVEDGTSSSTDSIQNQVDQLREEIGMLIGRGDFPTGLTLYDEASNVVPLANSKLKGREFAENLRQILSWFEGGVCRIGVYGVGGVGKTTLATHIHDELLNKLQISHENVYWVTVSDGITVSDLQSKIAKAIGCNYILDEEDIKKRAGSLRQALNGRKNSVLILDDVWTWKGFMLEDVGIPDGLKLLLTSRFRDVCEKMACNEIIKVGCLSEEESWEMFRDILGGTYNTLSQKVKDIACLISKKCVGLPLCIKVVAACMRGVDDIREWRNTLAKLTKSTPYHQGMENDVFPSLKLSYDRLNDVQVQKCFEYCVLYPQDYEFLKGKGEFGYNKQFDQCTPLVEAWIAEGLFEEMDSRKEQIDDGYTVLNTLLNACLLEPVVGNEKRVKMHDLVREMGIKIRIGHHHFMRQNVKNEGMQWTEDLAKVCMIRNEINSITPDVPPNCPNLSTLLLQENPICHITHNFFSKMKGLNVLNLSRSRIERLPDSISDLENLTALLICGCRELIYVPSLVKLGKLRELDLCGCSKLCVLPQGMEGLTSLKVLDCDGLRVPLSGIIPALSHVQELRLNPHFESIKGVDLVQLAALERLEGYRFTDIGDFCRYVNSQHYLQLNRDEVLGGESDHSSKFICISFDLLEHLLPAGCKFVGSSGWRSEDLIRFPRDMKIRCLLGPAGEIRQIKIQLCPGIEFLCSSAPSLFSPYEKFAMFQLLGSEYLKRVKGPINVGVLPRPLVSFKHVRVLDTNVHSEKAKKLFTMAREHLHNLEKFQNYISQGMEGVNIGVSRDDRDDTNDDASSQVRAVAEEHNHPQHVPSSKKLEQLGLLESKSVYSQTETLLQESPELITTMMNMKLFMERRSLPSLGDGRQLHPAPVLRLMPWRPPSTSTLLILTVACSRQPEEMRDQELAS